MFPPRADYVRFRMQTMYGTESVQGVRTESVQGVRTDFGADVCLYLEWCRRVNALERLERRRFRNSLPTRLSQR